MTKPNQNKIPAKYHLWNFSTLLLPFFRPLLLPWALAWASGVPSTFWKVMATIIRVLMLMCHKVTHKNLTNVSPLFPTIRQQKEWLKVAIF